MLTYSFSRREKAMILALVIVLVIIAWFVLVYQRTANEIIRIDSEIATVQSEETLAQSRIAKMNTMQAVIDKYKEAGIEPNVMPQFDNMTPLMAELNGIMAATSKYSLSFEGLNTQTSPDYVLRPLRIDFSCDSYDTAENIISALANGAFPCSIDSVSISNNAARGGGASASVHVTFYEKVAK